MLSQANENKLPNGTSKYNLICIFVFTPGSVLGLFRNPDFGSRIPNLQPIFLESLITIFLVIILRQFLSVRVPSFKIRLFKFWESCGYNKGENYFSPSSFLLFFWNLGRLKIRIRDKPGYAPLYFSLSRNRIFGGTQMLGILAE
jgi:hypothetical protein